MELFDDCSIRFKAVDGMLQVTAPRDVSADELKQEIATNKEQLLSVIVGVP